MTTNESHPYPIISKVTRDPYFDIVHESEMQLAAMRDYASTPAIDARRDALEDMIDRFCE